MNGIEHGGPDGAYAVVHDFSTNANPLGPPEAVMAAVQCADRHRCPDLDYAALRLRVSAQAPEAQHALTDTWRHAAEAAA